MLIAEDEEQLDKALAVRERLPALSKIVLIDPRNVSELDDPMVIDLGRSSRTASALEDVRPGASTRDRHRA